MLIAENPDLLFVHIQKTAGSSIRNLLAEQFGAQPPKWRSTPLSLRLFKRNAKPGGVQMPWHIFIRDARPHLAEPFFENAFKFCFVRNPWDRLVSWYAMITQDPGRHPDNKLWQYALDNADSFEAFIRNCADVIEMDNGVALSFAFNQLDYITDENGELLVDFIGRFEQLQDDLNQILDKLGRPPVSLGETNRSSHRHYRDYYTEETQQIVADRFSRDIAYFGYAF